MIFEFHPKPHLNIIVVFRSFQQNQDQLFDLSHLNDEMLRHGDRITLKRLKTAGLKVLKKTVLFCPIRNVFNNAKIYN